MKRRSILRHASVACWLLFGSVPAWSTTLVLDGQNLTVNEVARFARDRDARIEIAPEAMARVSAGFNLIMEAAVTGLPVYGLTVGVGWNKDRPVFKEVGGKRVPDDALLEASRRFNRTSLRAHGGGIGDDMPVEVVRAGMLVRLNTLLSGIPGAQPTVVETYRAFLNEGLTPIVPERGSVGEADITLASHIGLAMVGEWFVDDRGRRMPAGEAMARVGIAPLEPVGKDFLAIISTNALTTGKAALLSADAAAYLDRATIVFGLALEGLNGNIAPYLAETTAIRPFPGVVDASTRIREALTGSYLWQSYEGRALQDPLSFRTAGYAFGNALEALRGLESALAIQINHTDDNPAAITGEGHVSWPESGQVARYRVEGSVSGSIYPTANFEMLPVATRLEHLSGALARLSQNLVMQTIRFENPDLTKLPRFLAAPTNEGHAFGAMQKPLVALYAENRQLAMPVSLDTIAIAGNIEDTSSHAPLAASNLGRVIENMYHISSIQLLHAAQAVDLRGSPALGRQTRELHTAFREVVPFVSEDRIYTDAFADGVALLRRFEPSVERVTTQPIP